ncbi:MAG: ATP-binding cassette domain-containing protein [Lachnospiraceae bacterium]
MICISQLYKKYDRNYVLENVSFTLEENQIYCLMGPSGEGKTTLMHILMGLITPDSGVITGLDDLVISAVFQDNRLYEVFSPYANIQLTTGSKLNREKIISSLSSILPNDCIFKPIHTLSGGMKRRVAICRAILFNSNMVIMDEPFSGLDFETKKNVISYIKENQNNRTILVSTHQEEDVELLKASVIQLEKMNHF